ncbi:hypothetical protein EYF80_035569 [Liparis tanakae]|uniref:Uncharacterized protein n=1 Tax=Liparis tanakae TaxID=230148 RepID=A0A4Z2GKZ9_9TELE|nr:hypothetical protein EYF80_035569 [Liparis tanakae]
MEKRLNCSVRTSRKLCVLSVSFLSTRVTRWFPEQAVSDLKDQLRSDLESLQDKRDRHKQVEETYEERRCSYFENETKRKSSVINSIRPSLQGEKRFRVANSFR